VLCENAHRTHPRKEKQVRRSIGKLAMLGVVAAATVVLPPAVASAHALTHAGPYTLAIGFGTEPAYVDIPNSVEVIVQQGQKGVDSAANSLNATVTFGSEQPHAVTLEPNFDPDSGGSPGDYRGAFVPTQPGKYAIHVFGRIGSTKIDKTFTSSPTTFDTVTDPSTIEYPTRLPTLTELNLKLDRDVARVQAEAASTANDAVSSAKALAIVGIVVGAIGIVIGGVALARRTR
jgi:hypothetical protein